VEVFFGFVAKARSVAKVLKLVAKACGKSGFCNKPVFFFKSAFRN
jgi:hypothetical protein